jgi:T-complex protein 1 subunit theta
MEQYAIKKFAESLEVVPRTLAENGGQKATEVISALYAAHEAGEARAGVNISDGGVQDTVAAGVVDVLATKLSAVKLAADAAITVLRVDTIIMAKPAGGPKK